MIDAPGAMCCPKPEECYVKSGRRCVCGNKKRADKTLEDVFDKDRPRGAAAGQRLQGSAGGK